ncbi:hypothetical protein ACIBJF_52780 [Streptomyces sp. NPDC050743]|uniref:hypothetical protein n=1 Tax=Streptomyces sp. NPDC050743 TaxID=3365634 RepID=UPI0037974FA8
MSASFELPAIAQPVLETLLLGLAGNPSAPPEVLIRLTAANIDRSGLAGGATCPRTLQRRWPPTVM